MNKKYQNDYNYGYAAEDRFKKFVEEVKNMKVVKSTKEEDMYKHIDFWIQAKPDTKKITVDVKSSKKITMGMKDDFYWIELKNVQGNKGWLYGEADIIAFEFVNHWVLVDRCKIVKFVEKYIKDEIVENKQQALYKKYSRVGRKDVLTLVRGQDLMSLEERIWIKIENDVLKNINTMSNKSIFI